MRRIGIGLVGSGFMGRAHALAFRAAANTFALPAAPVLDLLADVDAAAASAAAARLGFARSTPDWRALVADPAIDLVCITTPNALHKPIALAALAAGKHVHCEKPLAPTAADAHEMAEAAEAAGVCTSVGFNYLRNPMLGFARDLLLSGELGAPVSFRGLHAEGYMASAEAPWTWRLDPAGGHGAVADLGSHILSVARFLMGEIVELSGQIATVVAERPSAAGPRRIEVDDIARAHLLFTSGATGSIEASWVATGRTMSLTFELTCARGTIAFDQERLNELHVFREGRTGFETILAGPQHPPYDAFCPAPGHQLGFNDLKTIEARDVIRGIAGEIVFQPDFAEAARIQAAVDAIVTSARTRAWVRF